MRAKILTHLPASLLLLLLAGCQSPWHAGGQPYASLTGAFTLEVPAGWVFAEVPPGRVIATKGGLILQRIEVRIIDIKDPLPGSKRVIRAGATPLELTEALVDDLRADHSLLGLEVVENQPVDLDAHPGFRVVISFHTEDNLRLTQGLYGVLVGQKLYTLTYSAPSRYYFAQDRATFEAIAKSFRLTAH